MSIRGEWIEFVRARANEWLDGAGPSPDQAQRLAGELRTIADVCETSTAGAVTDSHRAYAEGLSDAVFCIMGTWSDHPDFPPARHGSGFTVSVEAAAE